MSHKSIFNRLGQRQKPDSRIIPEQSSSLSKHESKNTRDSPLMLRFPRLSRELSRQYVDFSTKKRTFVQRSRRISDPRNLQRKSTDKLMKEMMLNSLWFTFIDDRLEKKYLAFQTRKSLVLLRLLMVVVIVFILLVMILSIYIPPIGFPVWFAIPAVCLCMLVTCLSKSVWFLDPHRFQKLCVFFMTVIAVIIILGEAHYYSEELRSDKFVFWINFGHEMGSTYALMLIVAVTTFVLHFTNFIVFGLLICTSQCIILFTNGEHFARFPKELIGSVIVRNLITFIVLTVNVRNRDLNSRQEFAARYILKEQKIECKFRMQGSEKLDRLVQAVLKRTGTFFQPIQSSEQVSVVQKPMWSIDPEEISLGRRLGKGSFGDVYSGLWRGKQVAVKRMINLRRELIPNFISELAVWSQLRHPNVCLFMGACIHSKPISIVSEYLPFGSLFGILHEQDIDLSWSTRLNMINDTALGLNYLHCFDPKVVHSDVKSPNLLVDEHFNVKVTDFGLSTIINRNSSTFEDSNMSHGSLPWMAPEMILGNEPTEKVDVYAFGIVMWELVTRTIPFEKIPLESLPVLIGTENITPEIPESTNIPEGLIDLMQSCWHKDPESRPSVWEILNHISFIIQTYEASQIKTLESIFERKRSFSRVTDIDEETLSSNLQIRSQDLDRLVILSSGGISTLLKAEYRGTVVAVKKFEHFGSWTTKIAKVFRREVKMMSTLRHPNVLILIGVCIDPDFVAIVTPFMERGALTNLLYSEDGKNGSHATKHFLGLRRLLSILIDAATGMAYLHSASPTVIHRDLKSGNILVSREWIGVIGDFGFTRFKECSKRMMTHCGTLFWTAPEILQGREYTEAVDVYSFGIVISEVLTGRPPYIEHAGSPHVLTPLICKDMRPTITTAPEDTQPIHAWISTSLGCLAQSCWVMEPEKRPSMDKILCTLRGMALLLQDDPTRIRSVTFENASEKIQTQTIPKAQNPESLYTPPLPKLPATNKSTGQEQMVQNGRNLLLPLLNAPTGRDVPDAQTIRTPIHSSQGSVEKVSPSQDRIVFDQKQATENSSSGTEAGGSRGKCTNPLEASLFIDPSYWVRSCLEGANQER